MNRIGPTKLRVLLMILAGQDRGHPPSIREMAVGCGLSQKSLCAVQRHLDELDRAGLISRRGTRTYTANVSVTLFK